MEGLEVKKIDETEIILISDVSIVADDRVFADEVSKLATLILTTEN